MSPSRMLSEIREQPAALERTLRNGLGTATRLARAVSRNRPKLIVLVARGTSDNAALFGRYLLEIATGIPVCLAAPSITTLYNVTPHWENAMVVAVSQSGESTDTNLVLERAGDAGALTVGVTNEPRSTLAHLAQFVFQARAGHEHSIAATKTYTSQLLLLYLLGHALGARISIEELRRLPEQMEAALSLEPGIAARAERYRFMQRAIVVGRGLNYANAFEFALKLMETCYVVAERFSSADLLHGPIAVVERSFPAFLFAPPGATWPGTRDLLSRLSTLKAEALVITDSRHREAAASAPRALVIPARPSRSRAHPEELYTPIPYIVPAQIFTALLAEQKGIDPDRPRALSKITRTL